MDSGLPKVKTIRVMLCEMDEQQDAMFRMAFKMHNITNYEIVDENSAEKPDMLLVDVDSVNGIQPWNELKKKYGISENEFNGKEKNGREYGILLLLKQNIAKENSSRAQSHYDSIINRVKEIRDKIK